MVHVEGAGEGEGGEGVDGSMNNKEREALCDLLDQLVKTINYAAFHGTVDSYDAHNVQKAAERLAELLANHDDY